MIKRFTMLFLVLGTLTGATSAFALFDGELRYGKRWYEQEYDGEKDGVAFAGATLAGHLGLLPIVSFGAYLSSYDMVSADQDSNELKSANIFEIGLDVLAEIPLIPIITPFGRVQLPLSSTYELKGDWGKGTVKSAHVGDFIVSVGAEYSPIPMLGITFEVGQGVTMWAPEKQEDSDGNSVDFGDHDKDKKAASVATAMLGVNVGF